MSHIAEVELTVQDLDSLESACKTLGLELIRGQKTFKWYAGNGKCEHAIHVPNERGAYEIGLVSAGEGYTLQWDDFDETLREIVGDKCLTLQDAYAAALSASHYEQLGYMVTQEKTEDGAIVLTATR